MKQNEISGWLEPYDVLKYGKGDGVIPLMAASQPNKPKKVRPVMDYQELNSHVETIPGQDTVICQENVHEWRKQGTEACLLNLKKAYLQIHVSRSLQKFQTVKYKGKLYVMTRMGFGLSVAPKIISRIISTVLAQDNEVKQGTDHYIDIWVNKSLVRVDKVRQLLLRYGLVTKEPEPLNDVWNVLELRVGEVGNGNFTRCRDGELPMLQENMTRR